MGTDAGLPGDEHIKIPTSCLKKVYYTLSNETFGDSFANRVFSPKTEVAFKVEKAPDDVTNLNAYSEAIQRFVLFGGGLYAKRLNVAGKLEQLQLTDNLVDTVYCEQWDHDDIKAFLCANDSTSSTVDNLRRSFFDACRLLSVMLGVGLTDHDKEWKVVEDPADGTVGAYEDSRVHNLLQYATDTSTALCVRAAMFR